MFCILQAHKPELNRCAYAQHNEQCWVCKDYQAGKTKPAYPVPAFTCHAARYTTHCEEFGYKPCNVCAAYELGLYEPHYPVPAIRYEHWHTGLPPRFTVLVQEAYDGQQYWIEHWSQRRGPRVV